jgi:ribulose 1,5-bisphosphate synthetase/thiazole synthase
MKFDVIIIGAGQAGLSIKGDQSYYPAKDEIASYLVTYANIFSLPVQCNTVV